MRFYLTDCHLLSRRFALAGGESPRARLHLEKAETLVRETGYSTSRRLGHNTMLCPGGCRSWVNTVPTGSVELGALWLLAMLGMTDYKGGHSLWLADYSAGENSL
jgi:hypothetical protein